MELKPVTSSNIKAVGYDEENNELQVEFNSGGIYAYDGVSKELYEKLLVSTSKGAFLWRNIKEGKFKFRRVK